jgi:acyl transferase domain-containing protein
MGGVFPGAPGLDGFRRWLRQGRSAFVPVPAERWDGRRYRGDGPDQTPVTSGAFLTDLPEFPGPDGPGGSGGAGGPDARAGRVPRAVDELYLMERALLLAAREAAADAGWPAQGTPPGRVAVILGFMDYGTSSQRNVVFKLRLPEMLAAVEASPAFQALAPARQAALLADVEERYRVSLRGASGREDRRASVYTSVAAARVASLLDVRGPHMAVDAACASSLAALGLAIDALHDGRYDAVVCGAASPQITPLMLAGLARLGMLREDGVVPFGGRERSGTLLGEGAGVLILRRLDDAVRDGQRVHAVLRGLGRSGTVDGRAAFASSPASQARALRQAYARAGYGPESVQYVEAHANGVFEGDLAELQALDAVFAERCTQPVFVGSVKERIGYLLAGAGMAGMLRTILAMRDGVLPHQVSLQAPGRDLPLGSGPLAVSTREQPWLPSAPGLPRRASVSAFGFGGANFHLTLESYEPDYHREVTGARTSPPRPRLGEQPVAIRGMGAVLPGSPDVPAFWATALTLRQAHGLAEDACVIDGRTHRGARVHHAGIAPARARIPPVVARSMDPQHLWLLDAAYEAVASAGLELPLPPRTAVFLAAVPHGPRYVGLELRVAYAEFHAALADALAGQGLHADTASAILRQAEQAFKAPLPAMTEDAMLGCMRNVAAGRLAHALGVTDPAMAVDAGCSSACAALDLAAHGLASGAYDLAVVAAMAGGITPEYVVDVLPFNPSQGDSCRPFEAEGEGCFPGEGAVVHILQRAGDLAGAQAHAVIRGVGASGNGRQKSLHAVSTPAMIQAIREAVDEAGMDPATVGMIEAHGSCTHLGDRMEASALARLYGRSSGEGQIFLSCLKPIFGNLMAAAGAASLAGAALALRHGLIPPNPRFVAPSPEIPLAPHGFVMPRQERPWAPAAPGLPRRAGLSSYSIGGLNYHIVLEEAPRTPARAGGGVP